MEQFTVFKWPIENFSTTASRTDPNLTLDSKEFTLQGTNFRLFLRFNPTNKIENRSQNHSSLFLFLREFSGETSVTLRYRLWLENNEGRIIGLTEKNQDVFNKLVNGWGRDQFVHHDMLYSPNNDFVKDDFVFACCQVQVVKPKKTLISSSELKFREKLYSFYDQGITDNCIFQSKKEPREMLTVPKAILMSQSKVFEAMFVQKNTFIEVNDVSLKVMKQFVKYLYVGKVENLDSIAQELFLVAERYKVDALMEECVESLSKTFNKSNILKRLHLAFMYKNEILKQNVLTYITDHNFEGNFRQILKTAEWKTFMNRNSDLAIEITEAIFEKTHWLS